MDSWTPEVEGSSLVPPGFKRRRRIPGHPNYVLDHPTRYRWVKHVQPMLHALYYELGGPDQIHLNTYVWHPPYNAEQGVTKRYDLYSVDVWGPGGRGDPVGNHMGGKAWRLIWNYPGVPYIDWIIWRAEIRIRAEGLKPRPYGTNAFEWHYDHVHCTFV